MANLNVKTQPGGIFVVSLDFELRWGVRDKKSIADYSKNLLGVRSAVHALLELFNKYQIHVTWGTVGFLFFETRSELLQNLPVKKPDYVNAKLCPYRELNLVGADEQDDPLHFGMSLIETIKSFPHQEIGSHTFSHYYCLERGQDIDAFSADLEATLTVAKRYNFNIESLIFPRNQINRDYLAVCREKGINTYRGNESSWIYKERSREDEHLVRRGLRLLDAYFNLSSHNCYSLDKIAAEFPFNIPSSRFLRPYSNKLSILEPLRLQRILSDITYAARNNLVYHLWWHPEDFGTDPTENMSFLKKILDHYSVMRQTYGMESLNMQELAHMLMELTQKSSIPLMDKPHPTHQMVDSPVG